MRNACVVVKPEGKRSFTRPGGGWKDNIKIEVKENGLVA
jgi:hypothetical protein